MTILPNLDTFLAPDAIAIVGASSKPNKIGAVPVRYLVEHGYKGKIYPINPGAREIAGLPSYPSMSAVGAPIDLAIFALPAGSVEAALEDAISAGVKSVVMFSAGFAETGACGEQLQQKIAERARHAGIRILGPNCLGFMNMARSVYATFSPVVAMGLAQVGHIGMVCQSGAFGAYAYAMARERGVGLSTWITTGNESDISVSDCIGWMADDPETKVIMAYIEGCRDGLKLRRALDKARLAGKPVVMVKVGRTELGALTASSHTAALAGEDAVYDALFKQHGAWRARSIEEFFDIAHCLATSGIPDNDSVGILTVSGGVGVMMADDAAEAGLAVTELPATAQASIKKIIPFASTHNPVDLTGQVTADPALLDVVSRLMLEQAGYGSLLIFLSAFGMDPVIRGAQRQLARDLRRDFPGRLIIFSTLADVEQQAELAKHGCVCFADPGRAIRVLAAITFFHRQHTQDHGCSDLLPVHQPPLLHQAYNEAQAMRLLGQAGLPMVETQVADSRQQAMAKATNIGFPAVMKVLSSQIAHKSDIGGVRLNIQNETQAGEAYDAIKHALCKAGMWGQAEGVLLAPMRAGGVEMIVGARQDPHLGTVIMLGSGGVNVEVWGDVVLRLAPVNLPQAHEMISELRALALLNGFRGSPRADIDALAQTIVRLSEFAVAAGDTLDSVELNPLVVFAEGQGALALDAVLLTKEPAALVLQTLPLFEIARMRAANTQRKHPEQGYAGDSPASSMRWVNQFTHTRRLRSPADTEVVTPNNDTLFTNAWLDLSAGPLVIDVPEMGQRYWVLGFLDAWTNPWAYAGRRTTGGAAQRLFVHGPGWSGAVPEGMHVISSPSQDVWIIGRILADAEAGDLAQVHALQDRFKISRLDGTPALTRIDALFTKNKVGAPTAQDYLRVLDIMLKRNPSEFPVAGWPPPEASLQLALDHVYTELREAVQSSELGGGWTTAVNVRESFGADFLTRARVARNWIGTLGIDEAMYIMAEVDEQGQPLRGRHQYALRFPPTALPDVGAFWSITLYGRSNCLLVDNPIGRHSIGDRTAGLKPDKDGGLTISIQADDPGPGRNWLPAPADDGFYLTLRLYQPGPAHLDGSFQYPAVRLIKTEAACDVEFN